MEINVHCYAIRVFLTAIYILILTLPNQGISAPDKFNVAPDYKMMDVSKVTQIIPGGSNRIIVDSTPDADNIINKIEVRSATQSKVPAWMSLHLHNPGNKKIERLLVIPHYQLVGSGIFSPDLGAKRLVDLSSSLGIKPENKSDSFNDIFTITLDPNASITFIGELASTSLPKVELWHPQAYQDRLRDTALFKGVIIGIAGLVSLVILFSFIARISFLFPLLAIFSCSVLLYLAVQLNVWAKFLAIDNSQLPFYRAVTEIAVISSFCLFLPFYLKMPRSLRFKAMIVAGLIAIGAGLVMFAFMYPSISVSIARCLLVAYCFTGFVAIGYKSARLDGAAILLLPVWLLLAGWIVFYFAALDAITTANLTSYIVFSGLVLIITSLSFIVMQQVFSQPNAAVPKNLLQTKRYALALASSGWYVWDFSLKTNKLYISRKLARFMFANDDEPVISIEKWFSRIHPNDRDNFKLSLQGIIEKQHPIAHDLRLLNADSKYITFNIKIQPVTDEKNKVCRCIGTIRNVHKQRESDRSVSDSELYDPLTGLVSRKLFLDRLNMTILRSQSANKITPVVLFISIDQLDDIATKISVSASEAVILTVCQRLNQLLRPQDTLARIDNDNLAIIIETHKQLEQKTSLIVDSIRKVLSATIRFMDYEIDITTSIGVSIYDDYQQDSTELLENAELAMLSARISDGGYIEDYDTSMRKYSYTRSEIINELQKATKNNEFDINFNPIFNLNDFRLAGLEASFYWHHSHFGKNSGKDIAKLIQSTNSEAVIVSYLLDNVARILEKWESQLGRSLPVLINIDTTSTSLLNSDFLTEIHNTLTKYRLAPHDLILSIPQQLLTVNPEMASYIFKSLAIAGVGLGIANFDGNLKLFESFKYYQFNFITLAKELTTAPLDARRLSFISAIVNIANELEITVIGQNLSNSEQVKAITQLGCNYGSGSFFGDNISPKEIEATMLRTA